MSPQSQTVLVIGGGVAGASCAISLAKLGIDVLVVEKSQFPRTKTCGCCLGPAGLSALERLGVFEQTIALGVELDRWVGSFDGTKVDIALPNGLAIARTDLDTLLLRNAETLGATVLENISARVKSIENDHVEVLLSGATLTEPEHRPFDFVVMATGLNAGGINDFLPWIEPPSGPFGASFLTKSKFVPSGTILMACDDDGYVGVVRLADGSVDVAAALRSTNDLSRKHTPRRRIQRILSNAGFVLGTLEPTSSVMATPKLRRRRLAGNGRLIAVGDAAGYIEPFTGEGMTWAMQGGILAADVIVANTDPESLGREWVEALDEQLVDKHRSCMRIARALESPWQRKWASRVLKVFPGLTRPILNHLNRV